MATLGTRAALRLDSLRVAKAKKALLGRPLTLPWILFLVIGLPLGLMAVLGPLAYAGIYVEHLRQLWRPWPPDIAKSIGAVAGFVATLAYLVYRKGRIAGYHSGTVAATASLRNMAERRGPETGQDFVPPPPTEVPPPVELPPPLQPMPPA